MKKILLLLTAVVVSLSTIAQISRGGEPMNWAEKDIDRFDVEFVEFETLDMELIRAQDEISDQYKDTPYRFGIEHDVNLTPDNSGTWEELENGTRVWRIGVHCPEARSISFHFNQYELNKGEEIYVWNEERTSFLGSFNHLNNKDHGELPVSFIHSSKVVVEYVIPEGVDQGRLSLSMVVHGYRALINKFDTERGPYGTSGNCNINVNCEEGDDWQVESKSVALILGGGSAVCTGAMVNNTANDGTPYFLTANHCLGNPANWTYLFNHESENCVGSNGPTLNTVASGDLRASNAGSDFALVELSQAPPESYNVQYCGWDKSDVENVTSAVGIHHPSGDVKKICFEEDDPYHNTAGGAQVWYIDQWEDGVTEPGSSGSPLFDQNHRIIGQLYGGTAACSGSVNNGQPDWYGRFGVSWDGNAASSRLRDWLDPLGVDPQAWDGWPIGAVTYEFDAGVIMETEVDGALCGDSFYPGVSIVNGGQQNLTSAVITVTMNGVVTQTIQWTGDLGNFESEFIGLDWQPTFEGANVLEVSLSNINDDQDENDANNSTTLEFSAIPNPVWFQMNLTLDQYGSETTWVVRDDLDVIYAEGGPYEDGQDQMMITEEFCVSEGCYDLTVFDAYGDGMCCGFGDGGFSIDNQFNVELVSGGEFGDSVTENFCASTTGVNEVGSESLHVYPNPTNGSLNVTASQPINSYRIMDLSGRTVLEGLTGLEYSLTISVNELSAGSYLVELVHENGQVRSAFIKE